MIFHHTKDVLKFLLKFKIYNERHHLTNFMWHKFHGKVPGIHNLQSFGIDALIFKLLSYEAYYHTCMPPHTKNVLGSLSTNYPKPT